MEKNVERHWDWQTAILLFLLMQVSAARLVTTDWAPYLYYTETMAGMGSILGLALGSSRFRRRAVVWLGIGYTLAVLPWQLSGVSGQKLLQDRLIEVGGILLVSLGEFMRRQPVKDPLFFVAFASLVFWLVALIAGFWAVRRRNILVGIIPSGILMLVIQVYANYQPRSSWWLAFYLLIALLLVGRVYFVQRQKVWAEQRVYVHEEAWTNILGGLFVLAVAAILVAWTFPTSISSMQPATEAWSRLTRSMRDRLSNAVTSLTGPYGKPGTNYYESTLLLGQNAAEGDTAVFTVEVLKPPESFLRFYWRARVYDRYDNGKWTLSQGASQDFEPSSNALTVPDLDQHSLAELRFTLQFPTQTLIYAPNEPVWVSRSARVQTTPVQGGLMDVLNWQATLAMPRGSRYDVHSEMANPDIPQLRDAPAIYPKWVEDRYLQIPEDVQPDIERLARQVTAGLTNPYDKATAITTYLRMNLRYSTSVPPAPEGRDPIDWVLFNYKQGFCTYYASAEVLMLRSVGVPARLAVGFAQGDYKVGVYTVRRRDAHAWPEVYFPGWGWVEFEPTTSQLALVRTDPNAQANPGGISRPNRPLNEGDEPLTNPQTGTTTKPGVPFTQTPPGRVLLIALYVATAAVLVYLFYRFRLLTYVPVIANRAFERSGMSTPTWILSWLRWNRLNPVEQAFAPVSWSLRWLGKAPAMDATPAERAAALRELLPSATDHIEAVTSELHTGLFSAQPADVPRARREGWQVLVHTLRARLNQFLGV